MRQRRQSHENRQLNVAQMGLFYPKSTDPNWRDPPVETRIAVTNLIGRLLREHQPCKDDDVIKGRRDA